MARTASTKLDSRAARAKLKPRSKAYNQTVAPRRMLGYVRVATGAGRWVALAEVGRSETGSAVRRQGALGLADDLAPADGEGVLSYAQALSRAAAWDAESGRSGGLTVRQAIESYLTAKRAADGEESAEDAAGRLRLHVLCEDEDGTPLKGRAGIGERRVSQLTLGELRSWRDGLVTPSRTRGTVNRCIANLKAAFNHAHADESNGIESDSAWRRLESFRDTDRAREFHFSEADALALIEAAAKTDKAFAVLCEAAFYSGARYGELTMLDVGHFDARRAQLVIPGGKTGARITTLSAEAVAFFKSLAEGRRRGEPLFPPPADSGVMRWSPTMQSRRMRDALKAAGLEAGPTFYAFRHSYISRSIERGMPLTLIAENCGTSVRMIEKNYGKFLAAARRDLIERSAPRLRVIAKEFDPRPLRDSSGN